ncbi:MAG: fumarylacetoacetate hydrolase family protein [Ignavibacteria bacterium]|nr:fumarylacetoacetate hydrolase family protein [Ignavibacteria bacterium]
MHQEYPSFIDSDGHAIAVGTFYCIGRNYAAHAREMGAEVPKSPLVFLKPPAAFVPFDNAVLHRPGFSSEMHHEVEIAIVIGKDIPLDRNTGFESYIAGYGIALDLTLRDVQQKAKEQGGPWALSKGFRHSAPVSKLLSFDAYPQLTFSLSINGEMRQKGDTNLMERPFESLIAYCHSVFSLREGDCILTGTPEGVGPLYTGDVLTATIDGYLSTHCSIAG